MAPSKGQAKTLILQGGITLNDNKVEDISYKLSEDDFEDGYAILKKGKKALEKNIKDVVYDRGGYIYHGVVKALAEAAREAGLNF